MNSGDQYDLADVVTGMSQRTLQGERNAVRFTSNRPICVPAINPNRFRSSENRQERPAAGV